MNVLERVSVLEKRAEEDRARTGEAFGSLFNRVAAIEEVLGIGNTKGISDCNTSVGCGSFAPMNGVEAEQFVGTLLHSDTDERLGRIERILKNMEERRRRDESLMQEAAASILDEPAEIKKRQNPPRSVRAQTRKR